MSAFPDARHLASGAAVCPGNRESGGKQMSGRTRKGNCYLRRILCQAAWAATRKKDSYLGTVYRRVRGRRGHQKAIMALGHRMLTIIFHMLRDDQPYRELGTAYNNEKRKAKNTARMVRGLEDMGFRVTLEVLPTPEEIREFGSPAAAPKTEPSVPRRGRPCKCAERGLVCKHQILPPPPSPQDATEIYSQ